LKIPYFFLRFAILTASATHVILLRMGGGAGAELAEGSEASFFRIPVNLYQAGDIIEEDLYFLYQSNYLLYRLKNLPWKVEDQKQLESFGIENLFIRCGNKRDHRQFLEIHLNRILDEPKIPSKEKAKILYETSVSIVEEVFSQPTSSEYLKRSLGSVKHSIDYLSRDKSHFFDLMSLAKSDFSEYTHALHVAAYSITLARELGIRAFNQASSIGVASILHDIGKVRIDPAILNKGEVLTEEEMREVQKHPIYGYEMVHRLGSIPSISEQMILHHHERPNGKGYPKGLSSEIHFFTKIISLCDCFDLMTSDRIYKKAMKPIDAIEYLKTECVDEYDHRLLVNFIKMLKR